MRKVYILGGGMGDPQLLTGQALSILGACDEVYAFDRLAEQFSVLHKNIRKCSYTGLISLVEQSQADKLGILVSGDTGFYSAARQLKERLGDSVSIESVCGINSLQYLCSKLNIGYEAVNVISLHGRKQSILGSIAFHRYTFVLTGSDNKAEDILRALADQGLGHIKAVVGEGLSMEQERMITGTVHELSGMSFDALSVILFENDKPAEKERPLFDEDFVRDRTPMTKQEVRWTCVNRLELRPEDTVLDIGAGTGSVAIEMSRKVFNGIVYAIEREEEALRLLKKNIDRLGAFNVIPVQGNAAGRLKELPVPDKVFIGGSAGELKEILDYLFEVNPQVGVVINAIALETLSEAVGYLKEHGCGVDITCMNIARNKAIGEHNLMLANNPVYIIKKIHREG